VDWFYLVWLILIWTACALVWVGNFWFSRRMSRSKRAMAEMVGRLTGGCAPGTHVWRGSGAEPLVNQAEHIVTLIGKLECARCGEVIPLDIKVGVNAAGRDGPGTSIDVVLGRGPRSDPHA
jgi:hypothetical protein